MNKQELIDFEDWVVKEFALGHIKSPCHLSGGNEDQLIEIFKEIKPQDWVFTTYRSHYHALLKGVNPDWLKQWILDNKSIHVMNKEHKIVSSAIVGGTLSQAVGCAMASKSIYEELLFTSKNKENQPHIWAFIGDMTASLGTFNDCLTYSVMNKLPITFVIENNELSTDTPTHETWGVSQNHLDFWLSSLSFVYPEYVKYYKYKRVFAHYGTNKEGEPRAMIT